MLTQLSTLKSRLNLPADDSTNDVLLTRAISAISARFDLETNRTLPRTAGFVQEFDWAERELVAKCYPIESISKFELKSNEAIGWVEQPDIEYLIRNRCIISLSNALAATSNLEQALARVVYTGGYLLPGDPVPDPAGPGAPPTTLPAELEHAAIEQTAFWFQTRDKLGVLRQWPKGGSYEQFADIDLLPNVRAILQRHTRFII